MMSSRIRLLCLGDVVGRAGREAVRGALPRLRERYLFDAVIINGENAAGGLGVDAGTAVELKNSGANVITLGDHTWHKKGIGGFLNENHSWVIRPANYAPGAPGRGWTIYTSASGVKVGVINVLGRVFIGIPLDCPFRAALELLDGPLRECKVVVLDMHAEATSEKAALAHFLRGRVSLVFGTHTHVPTADERILSEGTAFISDVGMCGGLEGVIGMEADVATERLTSGLPHSYEAATGDPAVQGIICEIDADSGRALSIERVRERA